MALKLTFYFSLLLTIVVFLFSCIVTMSDAQGALIFVATIPAMAMFLIVAWFTGFKLDKTNPTPSSLQKIPKFFMIGIISFFAISFVPKLNSISTGFMWLVGKTFEHVTGKTPYVYFRERKSFPTLLKQKLDKSKEGQIKFDEMGVTYAWDKVCIFAPYTNNNMAKAVLNIDWDIEKRSEIAHSNSINTLVFLYQGKPNIVIDLNRTLADFNNPNHCYDRSQTLFPFGRDENGQTIIKLP